MAKPLNKIKPWNVHGSEYVLQEKWITVRSDDCSTAGGIPVTPYYVLECSDWVHVVPFNEEGQIMLVELYRHGNQEISIEIPGGSVDPADGSPEAAARRELLEETGHVPEKMLPLGDWTPNSATHDNHMYTFAALNCRESCAPNMDDTEEIRHWFVPVEEVLEMIRDGRFRQALHIASIMTALMKLDRWPGR